MKRLKTILYLFTFLLSLNFIYCQDYQGLADKNLLKKNLTVLASDEYMGRETASEGERMAAEYIVGELKSYGIEPFGDEGTYFSSFPVYVKGFDISSNLSITNKSENNSVQFIFKDDYFLSSPETTSPEFSTAGSEIVFAGYGIIAGEYDYDDYKNLDVSGKIVVVMSGEPYSEENDFFEADYDTDHSYLWSKRKTAEERGAVALISLVNENEQNDYRYKARLTTRKKFTLQKQTEDTEKEKVSLPAYIFNLNGAQKLLGNKLENIFDLEDPKKVKNLFKSFTSQMSVSADYIIKIVDEKRTARNVLGILKGNSTEYEEQIVTIGAHYDHDGVKNGVVYNGADDNASGTVSVLEVARLMSKDKNNKRPVLFIFHTGEERGLLGSKYLAENSDFVKNIFSNINIDMIGREDENSIYSIGSDKISKDYHLLIEDVNKATVNIVLDYEFNHPNDPNRYYYRSDHYNYAKKGIPVVFFYDHMTVDYHKPTDDVEKINFNKVAKVTDLVYYITRELANNAEELK